MTSACYRSPAAVAGANMKSSPPCMPEKIRLEAVICKQRGKDLSTPATRSRGNPSRLNWLLITVAALALASCTPGSTDKEVMTVANDDAVDIPAASYISYEFKLNRLADCRMTGRVRGLAGGNKDFQVVIVDEDGFLNWKTSHRAMALFSTDQVAAATLDLSLSRPGTYYLVVSNAFSVLTEKTVQVNAKVTCGR